MRTSVHTNRLFSTLTIRPAHSCPIGRCQAARATFNEEAYRKLGLPEIISTPLAAKSVPRSEVAAAVLAIILDKDLAIAKHNARLTRLEGEHKALVQRYMQLRGHVGMQGIIEYVEEGMASQHGAGIGKNNRVQSWEGYLRARPALQARIAAQTRWQPSWIPGRIEALYEHLVSQFASDLHVPGDVVRIREGAVTRDQMAALMCLAEEHMISHDEEYLPDLAEQLEDKIVTQNVHSAIADMAREASMAREAR